MHPILYEPTPDEKQDQAIHQTLSSPSKLTNPLIKEVTFVMGNVVMSRTFFCVNCRVMHNITFPLLSTRSSQDVDISKQMVCLSYQMNKTYYIRSLWKRIIHKVMCVVKLYQYVSCLPVDLVMLTIKYM